MPRDLLLPLEEQAAKMAGDWQNIPDFCWFERPADGDKWCLYHYVNRDSGLLTQSNADQILKAMRRFTSRGQTATLQHFTHWAVGWVDALAVKVYDSKGHITKAFQTLYGLLKKMEDYPVLNEEDWSRRETEATLENIKESGRFAGLPDNLPENWEWKVYGWFADHDDSAIECRDDSGGYPDDQQMKAAFVGLGWAKP